MNISKSGNTKNEEMLEFEEERDKLKEEGRIAAENGKTDISGILKEQITDSGLVETGDSDVASSTDLSNITVVKAPLAPQRSDYPKTRSGSKSFTTAYKKYVIEEKKRQKNLIKPSTKNNNGITALNNTDGLTTINGSSSKTVVLQRQVVEKIVTVAV